MGRPVRNRGRQQGVRPRGLTWIFAVLLLAVKLVTGCSGDADRSVVTVYAASSLTDIMEQVEEQYEQSHPGIDVRINVAGTNTLIRQLNSGAKADIFVAADVSVLDQLIDPPIDGPHVLAVNTLTLVVPVSNPATIVNPTDVANPDVLTARCATGVPCGNATDRFLRDTGVQIGRSTDEPNVRSVLAKVSADEVDAGFVYRSDLQAATDITEIVLARAPQVTVGMVQLQTNDFASDLSAQLRSAQVAKLFSEMGFDPANNSGDQ